jgi:hypothetical protein
MLSLDLDDPVAVPYFLWDAPMSVGELRAQLRNAEPEERLRLLGKILREARDPDVRRFTTPDRERSRSRDSAPCTRGRSS